MVYGMCIRVQLAVDKERLLVVEKRQEPTHIPIAVLVMTANVPVFTPIPMTAMNALVAQKNIPTMLPAMPAAPKKNTLTVLIVR